MQRTLLHQSRTLRSIPTPTPWRPILLPLRSFSSIPPPSGDKEAAPPASATAPKPSLAASLKKHQRPAIPSPVEYSKVPETEKEFRTAKPPQLVRPIGVPDAPQPGENSGVDKRSWAEKRHDMVDYSKHKERRAKLTDEMTKPYFRDFSRLSAQFKGKSWMAPSLLFRADRALHFPNMVGRTLDNPAPENNTTHVLFGNVSVVGVFSSLWAQNQASTFLNGLIEEALDITPEEMEDMRDPLTGQLDLPAQRVDINVEENWMKAMLVRMFIPKLQNTVSADRWSKYFLVQKGLTPQLKNSIGYWNEKVGYVYLVDWNCRIRWAGSGNADPEERAALVKGIRKLIDDHRKVRAAMKAEGIEEAKPASKPAVKPEEDDD